MSTSVVLSVATPLALAAAWVLYRLDDLDSMMWIRRVRSWAAQLLAVTALLVPPAFTSAMLWIVTQEQERVNELIVEPMLEQFGPTTSTTEP